MVGNTYQRNSSLIYQTMESIYRHCLRIHQSSMELLNIRIGFFFYKPQTLLVIIKSYWSDGVLTITFWINRIPSEVLGGKDPVKVTCPSALLFPVPLKLFGSTCFIHISKQQRKSNKVYICGIMQALRKDKRVMISSWEKFVEYLSQWMSHFMKIFHITHKKVKI